MKKKIIYIITISIILLGVTGYGIYGYMYKAHRNIASEEVDYSLSSNDLKNVMRTDSVSGQFIDKVVKTEGVITSVEQNSVILNNVIQVNFINTDMSTLEPKAILSIKGRCVGYDDLLEVVKIDQATITNH
ncbi:hypothetical protein [Hyunsoonleella pacifica]|uniref:tRNA_anti-like n=1 Tax=Hyunsoonleella pacifica TaxID=1080224 RepID=A0A4Q9FSD1_9FLAO|nr:hypothetical protein [Hyunsoonleella pacifica]TBN18857.1 hypothetical protein EYD46_01975 [Hyunsoonleella pacifica]GGD05379.1 hypothetical protein GCM10011368_03950 [Hyunsoonleella pacifica]